MFRVLPARPLLLLVISLLTHTLPALAERTANVEARSTAISVTQDVMTIDEKAKMWGLTTSEYRQYLKEMATSPSSKWWKDLDPPQVLGQNAETQEERMKYAAADVAIDQKRAGREFAFQRAYSKAFKKLYPHAKLINIDSKKKGQEESVANDDKFFLFTPINDPEGSLLASKVIGLLVGKKNISFNIFFMGNSSFKQIQRWATNNNIPKNLKNSDLVTLNHNTHDGANKLKSIVGSSNVPLPLLVRVRGGKSQILSLLSV